MGFIIISSVHKRRKCRNHLCHRYIKILSEWIGSQIDLSHRIRRIKQSWRFRLSRKINPCILSKPKNMLIFCKIFRTDHRCHIHKSYITWICNGILYRFLSVSRLIVTADLRSENVFRTPAVIAFVSGQCSCFQAGRHSKRFRSRPRLISVTYAEISPKIIHRFDLIFFTHRIPLLFCIKQR